MTGELSHKKLEKVRLKIEKWRQQVNEKGLFHLMSRRAAIKKLYEYRDLPESIPGLIGALLTKDDKVTELAKTALHDLSTQEAKDLLFENLFIIESAAPFLSIPSESSYRHSIEGRHFLYLVISGQFDKYLEEDFEFQGLRPEFQAAKPELQARIRQKIVQSGDIRMNALFVVQKRETVLAKLSDHDADVLVKINARNKNWEELFKFFWVLPARHIALAAEAMRKDGWQPEDAEKEALLAKLLTILEKVGDVPQQKTLAVSLGPVMEKWLVAGKEGKPDPALETKWREQLQDEIEPPQQIAALAALQKAGRLTAEDLDKSGKSPHWLVRMAALVMGQQPEHPDDGAKLWFEKLSPVLDADAVWGGKPCDVDREALEILQQGLDSMTDRWIAGGLLFLEAVTAHYTAHDIEIEVGARVTIGEDTYEIEG